VKEKRREAIEWEREGHKRREEDGKEREKGRGRLQ